MSKQRSGCIIGGKWVSFYDQGRNNYMDGYQFRQTASPQWKAGWKAALNSDIALSNQCYKPSVIAKIQARVCQALGVTDCNSQGGNLA